MHAPFSQRWSRPPLWQNAQATDFSKVELKTTKIAADFYTVEGPGGTIGVLTGSNGVLMVDAEFAPLSEKIVAELRKISNGQVRFLINTHVHGDHTGGNENFSKTGAIIFARDEVRNRLAHPAPNANGNPGVPAPPAALPVVTFRGPVTFHLNGEEVEAIPIPFAHTDGDTIVRIMPADIIMAGDFYRSTGYPNIDRANGGSLKGTLEGLDVMIKSSGPNTKIVPGHSPAGLVSDRAALIAHRDMIVAIRDRVASLIQQGRSQAEVVSAKPTSDFDAKVPSAATTSERFIGQLYAELKSTK